MSYLTSDYNLGVVYLSSDITYIEVREKAVKGTDDATSEFASNSHRILIKRVDKPNIKLSYEKVEFEYGTIDFKEIEYRYTDDIQVSDFNDVTEWNASPSK